VPEKGIERLIVNIQLCLFMNSHTIKPDDFSVDRQDFNKLFQSSKKAGIQQY